MAPDDFAFLARLLRRRSGLSLTPDKMALLERRLVGVMRRFDFRDLESLVRELRLGREALADSVTEAMTVNETSFFRDPALFDGLRHRVLPRLLAARGREKRLRIWSAAAACGQEAYSIAMILCDMGLARDGWTIELIATDLSGEAIDRAATGRYASCELERTPDCAAMMPYFRDTGGQWQVEDQLRRMVTFRRFNLLDSFGWLGDLDIVFCRNVLMYFDHASRVSVLERIADTLVPDGVLLLGENETPQSVTGAFVADGPGIFAKSRAAIARAG